MAGEEPRRRDLTHSMAEGKRTRESSHADPGRSKSGHPLASLNAGDSKWGIRVEPVRTNDATLATMVTRSSMDRSRTPLGNTSSLSMASK